MKRVAVLRGGPSEEYDVSMNTGRTVLAALNQLNYTTKDIVITKKGEWLDSGITRSAETALDAIDVVFVALHGRYGEDGQVQKILQRKHIPFTGSRSLPSAIAFNKELTKRTLLEHGIKMPKHKHLKGSTLWEVQSELDNVFAELGSDLFIKPVASGSSFGASFVSNQMDLETALEKLLVQYEEVLVEEFIKGREAAVGVLQDFRGEPYYTLPAIEIVPPDKATSFSYEHKYSGLTEEICPGRFSYDEKEQLLKMAILAHQSLGCDHYSRSDFIVRNGEVYFLELNTLPGLTEHSLLPQAASAIGLDFKSLVQHLVETARV